jgi:methylenetetrahydrofolate reductase (NADPH)
MQLIRNIFSDCKAAARPVLSFEFFPPKTADGDRALLQKTLPRLLELKPHFCSVTYGAGGSTREKTLGIVENIQKQHGLTAMSHLTCVNARKEEIGDVLNDARQRGIRNILALRGDPPGGVGDFTRTEGGFEYSSELVEFIRAQQDFSIGVAGFPEGHIACKEGRQTDWDRLKRKIDSGADFVLTQFFFDNNDFYEFYNYLVGKLKVTAPINPGILPILSTKQITKFTSLCGAAIPAPMMSKLEALADDDEAVVKYGIEHATRQCEELLKLGVPGLHFYTLNKVRSTRAVLQNLGMAAECSHESSGTDHA